MRIIVSGRQRSGGGKPRLSVLFLAALVLVGGFAVIFSVIGPEDSQVSAETAISDATAVSAVLGTLESFGARSAEEAVSIWAEGVMSKNGLTQYAVMTDALKERYLEVLGEDGSFIFPTTSQRIESWYIAEVTESEDGTVSASLIFDVVGEDTAAASAELTIEDMGEYAAVSSIAVEQPLYEFTGIG